MNRIYNSKRLPTQGNTWKLHHRTCLAKYNNYLLAAEGNLLLPSSRRPDV